MVRAAISIEKKTPESECPQTFLNENDNGRSSAARQSRHSRRCGWISAQRLAWNLWHAVTLSVFRKHVFCLWDLPETHFLAWLNGFSPPIVAFEVVRLVGVQENHFLDLAIYAIASGAFCVCLHTVFINSGERIFPLDWCGFDVIKGQYRAYSGMEQVIDASSQGLNPEAGDEIMASGSERRWDMEKWI